MEITLIEGKEQGWRDGRGRRRGEEEEGGEGREEEGG